MKRRSKLLPVALGAAVGLSLVLLPHDSVAKSKNSKIRTMMGTYPKMPHNSKFYTHLYKPGQALDITVKGDQAKNSIYAVVGKTVNKEAYVFTDKSGLIVGGPANKHFAYTLWKVAAPEGTTFTGGTISAKGTLIQGGGDKLSVLSIGTVTDLKLNGGGSFWSAYGGVNNKCLTEKPFVKSSTTTDNKPILKGSINIPADTREFYVVVKRFISRGNTPAPQLRIEDLKVDAQLSAPAFALSVNAVEPLWTINDEIKVSVDTKGDTSLKNIYWRLKDTKGAVIDLGVKKISDSAAEIDFTGVGSGIFTVETSGNSKFDGFVAKQELYVVPAQNDKYWSETIFGALGISGGSGVHGGMARPDEVDIDVMKKMGMRWNVIPVLWAWTQKSRGAEFKIENIDLIKQLSKEGFETIVTTGTSPKWANGNSRSSAPPLKEFHPDWQKFHEEVARRLVGITDWFQTWNEPNNPHAFHQKPWDLEKRMNTVKELQVLQYKALKAGNPNMKLIGGNYAGVYENWFKGWLTEPFSTVNHQYGMSGHPYCYVTRENNWAHDKPAEPMLVPRIVAARKAMDENGAKDQPIHWTEYGWFTPKTPPHTEAKWTARQNIIQMAYKDKTKTESLCIFSPSDIKNGHSVFELNFNIKAGGHRFTPLVSAYTVTTSLLAGAAPTAFVSDYPNPIRCYGFERDNEVLYSAWYTEEAKEGKVALPVTEKRTVLKMNVYGSGELTTVDPNQQLELAADNSPIYWMMNKQAKLEASPKRFSFSNDLKAKQLNVGNIGPGNFTVTITADKPWIKVNNSQIAVSSSEPVELAVSIDKTAVTAGDHKGIITLKTSTDQSITIPVSVSKL